MRVRTQTALRHGDQRKTPAGGFEYPPQKGDVLANRKARPVPILVVDDSPALRQRAFRYFLLGRDETLTIRKIAAKLARS
jgi:hypothetical protein